MTLSLDAMRRAIRDGGSVLYGGRIITAEAQLPTPAELAVGDPAAEAAAADALAAQIADLQAQFADLQARRAPHEPPATDAPKGKKGAPAPAPEA